MIIKSSADKIKLPSSNAMKNILNGMDAYLYVSDLQTDEILFINDRMKERLHLDSEAEGGVCWKVLRPGYGKRCDFCPISRLPEDGVPFVWEEHDTVTGRYYRNTHRIIEWDNGKMVHLRHSIDITDIRLTAGDPLKKRLEQEELMSAISQSFATTRDIRELIYDALKKAGEFMGVNQAFLSKYQEDKGCLECRYEWYDEEGLPYIGRVSQWPITPEMEFYRDLTVNGYAAVNDYFMLTHPNFKTVKDYALRAFLNVPVEVSGEFWGVLGFIINNRQYDWSESDIHLGKLISGVFSGVIGRNIAENNLLEAKEIAERASHAKSDFLSRMSHEIRTPMNAVIGMTGIARKSRDPHKKEQCLEKIESASRHLLGLINDILDMSKIEADKLELSPVEFDFEKMLVNVASVVNFRVDEKKQNLIINIDKGIPSAFIGDEMRLSQVIVNLLTNAVKFSPEGGTIILNIHSIDVTDGISTLLIEVKDNGIGLSAEQQSRLFAPFEQADGDIARKFGGTGLGLAISKGIVELMGGRIWIDSELGRGSKFSFTVKMEIGSGPKTELSHTIDKNTIRILVVDATPEIRDYFTRVMSDLGLSCDVADSGASALEKMKRREDDPYTIYFVDWTLPDFDCFELTKKIRRATPNNAAVIMITSSDWNDIEDESAAAAGVRGFVFKPLFTSMLIGAINESMGAAPERETIADKTRAYDFKGYTLLVAEDIGINREIISAILEDTNIAIDFAEDGVEAFSMFESNPGGYDLILMDIQMPEMDGYEATRKIRAMDVEEAGSIPIIAMTANVFRNDIEMCIQAGMNDHIGKPVDTDDLLAKLDKYLHSAT